MKKQIVLLLFLALLTVSCSNWWEEPERPLPAKTQTGANTFGCRVNGKVWVASSGFLSPTPLSTMKQSSNYLWVSAYDYQEKTEGLRSISFYFYSSNDFENTDSVKIRMTLYDIKNNKVLHGLSQTFIVTDAIFSNLKTSFFDDSNHKISGEFAFTIRDTLDKNKVFKITEGRFDVKRW